MFQNPYGIQQMQGGPEMMNQNTNNYDVTQNFQKINLDDQNNITSDKNIVDSLIYYFSIENLNKDYFIRSKLDENGFLEATEIMNFNKMKVNSVTIDKIQNILNEFDTTIETKVEGEKLYLRNKNWETIKDKLLPIEKIQQQKKKNNKIQNTNYVNMQNNYYYQVSPQYMNPQQQMEFNPYMMQQMMGMPQMQVPMHPSQYQQFHQQDNYNQQNFNNNNN